MPIQRILKPEQIREIILLSRSSSVSALARRFSASRGTILNVLHGRVYRDVTGRPPEPRRPSA